MKALTIIFVTLFFQFGGLSQSRTGNIVEYFGKEKIDDIGEGRLHHVFTDGLLLAYSQYLDNASTFPDNSVIASFLQNPLEDISAGQVYDVDFQGQPMRWEAISTDSTNTFSDSRLRRSGYLYLVYKAAEEETVLFEGSGHTQVLINGLPHEGDHYDFGYSLIPIRLRKGRNTFLLTPGRFSRMRARLIRPGNEVILTARDMTLPDILIEENKTYRGAVRVINSKSRQVEGLHIKSKVQGKITSTTIQEMAPMNSAKIAFDISFPTNPDVGDSELFLELLDDQGTVLSSMKTTINIRSNTKHHKRTFTSNIDGSIQYFSVAPSTNQDIQGQALFLSVHGASVEAVNQANAYQRKDWGNLIAPTNRRPFGFAWEDWGRIDAMEVLYEAKKIYQPDESKIYLTGHSMGGHGTWYLGATYPDHFAAIAPCAGYPDLLSYRDYYRKRLLESPAMRNRFNISQKQLDRMMQAVVSTPIEDLIKRAGNPSRTLKLKRNYLQQGVYILHGEVDNVVPTAIAREMRATMGKFHNDFTYYEYPEGTHWYGNHSVDWPPIFDFFKQRTIPKSSEIDEFEFWTASPGVSSSSHFIEILQQNKVFDISTLKVKKEDKVLRISTENTATLAIDLEKLGGVPEEIMIDEQQITYSMHSQNAKLFLSNDNGSWQEVKEFLEAEKGPLRYGGFKDVFTNNVVLVYGTGGEKEAQEWNYNRARFDAETFWYRANGNLQLIRDIDFDPSTAQGKNVVLYGNSDNNQAWDVLLSHCPIQFKDGLLTFGEIDIRGDQWAGLFIYPKMGEDNASIGVVSATGPAGRKAGYNNNYLQNGTTYPDFLLFDFSVLTDGIAGVKCAGFFGNDWSIKSGDFEWK